MIGDEGQARLAAAHALLVGCGALGTVIADLLVRAGVGRLTLVDRDLVEVTNLQRQTLFDESDARGGVPKAEAAAGRLRAVNSVVGIRPVVADFSWRSAEELALGSGGVAVLLDGTDNFQTRLLMNDLAVKHSIPLVYAGAVGTTATSMTVMPGRSPCLRCIVETPPQPGDTATCDTAGVLGPVTAMVAAWQAAEAIKILAGRADLVSTTLLRIDLAASRVQQIDVAGARAESCPCCGERRFDHLEGRTNVDTTVLCGRNSVQVNPPLELITRRLDLESVAARLAAHGRFTVTPLMLRGRLSSVEGAAAGEEGDEAGIDDESNTGLELTLFPDGRAIVSGTTRPEVARSIYAKFVGV
ncbi:MAG: ThiF family adenylyltransferase [Phycisphaeraceae bacterium]|nr:ThiF family adenylyltransferase [Phycisphaeraceae bacterium]